MAGLYHRVTLNELCFCYSNYCTDPDARNSTWREMTHFRLSITIPPANQSMSREYYTLIAHVPAHGRPDGQVLNTYTTLVLLFDKSAKGLRMKREQGDIFWPKKHTSVSQNTLIVSIIVRFL
jgi:hypothetical protein